eukprot:Rmarinus@m.1568
MLDEADEFETAEGEVPALGQELLLSDLVDKDLKINAVAPVPSDVEDNGEECRDLPPAIEKTRQKVVFTIAVCYVGALGLLASGSPSVVPTLYTVSALVLIPARLYYYKQKRLQYFLLDFCYFANTLLLIYIWGFHDKWWAFHVVFAFSNGPLLWAVVAWRNSVVFHSLDKMTSFFIHILPPIVTYIIHWKVDDDYRRCEDPFDADVDSSTHGCDPSIMWLLLFPLLPYFFWQLAYVVVVQGLAREKIKHGGHLTSFKELTRKKQTYQYRLINMFGPRYRVLNFGVLQFCYTVLAMLPTIAMWKWRVCHAVMIGFIIFIAIWNGANFYIEVFQKHDAAIVRRVSFKPTPSRECSRDDSLHSPRTP